jgi:serine/threonine protein kinase
MEGVALLSDGVDDCLKFGLVLTCANEALWTRINPVLGGMQNQEQLRPLIFQMLLGAHELHFNGIWHRDFSASNWLFCRAPPGAPFRHLGRQLVVADLGSSKMMGQLKTHRALSVVYTPGYGAPEYVGAAEVGGSVAGELSQPPVQLAGRSQCYHMLLICFFAALAMPTTPMRP